MEDLFIEPLAPLFFDAHASWPERDAHFLEKRKIIEKFEVLAKEEGANHFISFIYCVHVFKGTVTCIFSCFPS